MKDYSTQNRMDIASELGIANEHISNIRQIESALYFIINGAEYSSRLTATGRHKKNSVRRDW